MTIETIEGFYIHITADPFMELTNGEVRTKEIYVPLNGDYSMWIEENEYIEPTGLEDK